MSDEILRQDCDGCVTLYKDFVKQLSTNDRQSLGFVEAITNNAGGTKSVTFTPENCYYNSNEWYALINNEKYKVLKARSNRNGGEKSTKSGGQPNSGGGGNSRKRNSKIAILEKKISNQKRQMSDFNTADKSGSDDEGSDGSEK